MLFTERKGECSGDIQSLPSMTLVLFTGYDFSTYDGDTIAFVVFGELGSLGLKLDLATCGTCLFLQIDC